MNIYGGQTNQSYGPYNQNLSYQQTAQMSPNGMLIRDIPVTAAGIDGANWYPVAAGHTLVIFDSTAPIFRIKTNDARGITIETFKYDKYEPVVPQENETKNQNGNDSDLTLRINSLESKLDSLVSAISQQGSLINNSNPVNQDNRNAKRAKGGNV